MKHITQYIFHYNSYKGLWACVDREYYISYMNGKISNEYVTYSDSIESLINLINPTPTSNENNTKEKESIKE